MNIAHLHLMLNHVPVTGSAIGVFLLGVALLRRSDELTRVTFGLLALVGMVALGVFFTGEPAEELVERLPGFSKPLVEEHEEIALAATIAVGALGAVSLVVLGMFRRRLIPRSAARFVFALSIASAGVMGYTSYLGGMIRHTEIRSGAANATSETQSSAEKDHDRH